MIIDIHTHYGIIEGSFNMPIEKQLGLMEKYHIDYALISNIECYLHAKAISGNKRMIELVREHTDKLGCMLWGNESLTEAEKKEFEQLYTDNKEIVKGIKIHPDMSHKAANDPCFDFFYGLAEKYNLPVLFHTKNNEFSSIDAVISVAKRYREVRFILGHMDIASNDCTEALEAVKNYDNIYGDTAWVWLAAVKKAAQMGIAHKMMFGTDSPLGPTETYKDEYYLDYFTFDADYMRGVMSENARRFFKI